MSNKFVIEFNNRASHFVLRNSFHNIKWEFNNRPETIMIEVELCKICNNLELDIIEISD